jgi:hypothetical protein
VPFKHTIRVSNPSPYKRSDYVEIDDLGALGTPPELDEKTLRLTRLWRPGVEEDVPFQIDYPFGEKALRTLTFFSPETQPGDPEYGRHDNDAEFLLEQIKPHEPEPPVSPEVLNIEHYTAPGEHKSTWEPQKDITGVELSNGPEGLKVYFSLVPRPEPLSPCNYAGAALSVLHQHAARKTGAGEALAPFEQSPPKRWGQLTHLDFYPLPWERRYYQTESLIGQPGSEPRYKLVWSRTGPHCATVSLKSKAIHVHYGGEPFFDGKREVTCYLYRVISMYPGKEFYTEQLIARPEWKGVPLTRRISLAFRAHFSSFLGYSDLDYPKHKLARFENIPDYFAVWKSFAGIHRGYAFASDSHVRTLQVTASEISWRLQLGHEYRCVHHFPFHCYPDGPLAMFHEVGHTAWYERLLKPLQAIPLDRYESHYERS